MVYNRVYPSCRLDGNVKKKTLQNSFWRAGSGTEVDFVSCILTFRSCHKRLQRQPLVLIKMLLFRLSGGGKNDRSRYVSEPLSPLQTIDNIYDSIYDCIIV